jgi:hypothetical protein
MSAFRSSTDLPAEAASPWLAWTPRAIERCQKRIAIFIRRGMAEADAEWLADRLVARDHDRDDRRACAECRHLQRDGGCFAARRGWLPGVATHHSPVLDILQRCARFEWQTS